MSDIDEADEADDSNVSGLLDVLPVMLTHWRSDIAGAASVCSAAHADARLWAGPWGLASLPLDPGHPLEEGGTWAEALGAWRQPTLLIIPWQQLPSGAAASTLALLRQWRVPILGVLQWGGAWSPEQRRRDGLPWLGRLEEAEGPDNEEATRSVTNLLLRQWSHLDHPWSLASGA